MTVHKRFVVAIAIIALLAMACDSAGQATPPPDAESPVPPASETPAPGDGTGVADGARSVEFEWGTFTLAQRIVDKATDGEALNIIINNQGTAIPVFGAQQRIGTERGCDESSDRMSIQCRLTGPATSDQTAQLAELETLLVSEQVDCLGVQSIVPDAYVDIINRYVEAGIPVFTQNTDVEASRRFAFFALSERDAGVVSGRVTAELVQEAGHDVTGIAVGSGGPEAPWAQDRMGGFEEGYRELFPDANFFNGEEDGLPTGPNFTTQEVIDSVGPFFAGNPEVNLFFHTDQGVEGVGTVIQQQDRTGSAWTSGFNVSEQILAYIDSGEILVTIDQGFDNQAEAAVHACVDFLAEGTLPPDPLAYLDPVVITREGGEGRITAEEARQRLAEATDE